MGGMLALLPADPDALAVDGGDPADQMHVTLVFLGDTDTVGAWSGDARRAALLAGVAALAQSAGGPLPAAAVGHATFAPGDPDSQCAVHLIGDCDRLAPLQSLAQSLAEAVLGDALPAQHTPWIPHATAGFGEGMDAAALDYIGPVLLDRLVLAIGEDWQTFALPSPIETHRPPARLAELATPPDPAVDLAGDLADGETDPDDLDDDALAAMADAALHNVADQRDRTHDAAALALAALMVAFAQDIDHDGLRAAVYPDAARAANRAAMAAEIARQARDSGHADAWADTARDAHTAAVLAGAAAAAHVLSAGAVPVDPAPPEFPDPFDPAGWVAEQQGGLAGDLVDALAGAEDDLTDGELGAIVGEGRGPLLYLDQQVSEAYLDASIALYGEAGFTEWWFNTMPGACQDCLDLEAKNPYSAWEVPPAGSIHPFCRCWVTPGSRG
jgi:hypothetical protein